VDVKSCVRALRERERRAGGVDQRDGDDVEALMNALRYTTKHLNDQNTPRATRAVIMEKAASMSRRGSYVQ